MIGIIWQFLTGNKIARTIGMVVMAVLGVLTFGAMKKREGARDARQKRAEATVKRVEAGSKGAAEAEADLRAGKTPEDIVRGNDNAWR
jgi:hypothetical protein